MGENDGGETHKNSEGASGEWLCGVAQLFSHLWFCQEWMVQVVGQNEMDSGASSQVLPWSFGGECVD